MTEWYWTVALGVGGGASALLWMIDTKLYKILEVLREIAAKD